MHFRKYYSTYKQSSAWNHARKWNAINKRRSHAAGEVSPRAMRSELLNQTLRVVVSTLEVVLSYCLLIKGAKKTLLVLPTGMTHLWDRFLLITPQLKTENLVLRFESFEHVQMQCEKTTQAFNGHLIHIWNMSSGRSMPIATRAHCTGI